MLHRDFEERPVHLAIVGCVLASILALYVLPSDAASTCPDLVAFDPAAGESTADTGWTGLAHQRPVFGHVLRMAIDCAPSTPPCGTCTFTGLLPDAAGMFQRCLNDTSIACTEATEVGDCGAVDSCAVFLTIPQSTAVGGVSSCYTNELTSPVSGSVGVESGMLDVSFSYRSRIYPLAGACPACVGDPISNDGVRGGTCDEGPRLGLTCDGNAASPYTDFGTSSFDCPPDPGYLAATLDVGPVTFSTGTQSRTLSVASPNCLDAPGTKCFCETCNNAAAEPCDANADCPDPGGPIGPICGGRRCLGGPNLGAACTIASECPTSSCERAGEPSRPNFCTDDTTTPEDAPHACADTFPLGDGNGHCTAGPVTPYCSNHPNRGCTSIADCDNVPGSCVLENDRCFVTSGTIGNVISAVGVATPPVADVSEPTALGMLACLPAAETNAVNTVIGLPGLIRNSHVGRLVFATSAAPLPSCPLFPATCRAPVVPGKSKLQLKDKSPDTKDQLRWRWSKGAATTLAELGDPTTIDLYDLCLYDGTALRASMVIPAGGVCSGKPCWKATSKGFNYKSKSGNPRGIKKLTLKSGEAGKASIQVMGAGTFLPLPTLTTLQAPLQMQLRHRESGLCWGASYPVPFKRSTATDLLATD